MTRAREGADAWPPNVTEEHRLYGEKRTKVVPDPTDDRFHIGQIYEKTAAVTLRCAVCGGDQFNVAQGHCFTAIRCVMCEWEECIHDG